MAFEGRPAFAVWLTGLPAAGKSTLAKALAAALSQRGIAATLLDSDEIRRELTPAPSYDARERDLVYAAIAVMARLLTEAGVPVLIAATGHRRSYRERARQMIPRFLEVLVECPLEVCRARDPKGIYGGDSGTVPGVGVAYEAPERPELVVDGVGQTPAEAASRILALLVDRGEVRRTDGGGAQHGH